MKAVLEFPGATAAPVGDGAGCADELIAQPADPAPGAGLVEIRPRSRWSAADLRELWDSRELIWILAARDLKIRYKQTILGVAWVMALPILTMLVFNVLFGILLGAGHRPTVPGVPYAISTFCALVPWQMFANSLRTSGSSLLINRSLISKVYFPRLVVLLAPIAAGLADFAVALCLLLVMIAGYALFGTYHFAPGPALLFIPFLTVLAAVTVFSISLWLAALSAAFRDFTFLVPITLQVMMYITPVIYSYQSIAPALGRWGGILYGLNPMAGVVEGFRWAILGVGDVPTDLLLLSCGVNLILLAGGLVFFHRMEQVIVDVI